MCEKQTKCGLYLYLTEVGKIKSGQNCPKPDPKECPRYNFDNGGNVEKARSVFKVDNIFTHNLPLSYEETEM